MTKMTRPVSSVHNALTCQEGQSAWALATARVANAKRKLRYESDARASFGIG